MKKPLKRILATALCCTLLATLNVSVFASSLTNSSIDIADQIQQKKNKAVDNLDDAEKQIGSIYMLNYLTTLTSEINESANSQLYLDNAYSSIIDNTYLNAVDDNSKIQMKELLDTINAYQSIGRKKERIQYLYQQNQAQAYKKAIPSPISVMNVVKSKNPLKAIISVVFLAVDAKSSYDNYVNEIDTKFLEDNWELDDTAKSILHDSRSNTFLYMIEMCQENDLDGNLALTEKTAKKFAEYEQEPNITRQLKFLEDNQKTYAGYGKYWLVLAKSYFENGKYKECLDAIDKYENLNIILFRYDRDLAKSLSFAISAARELYANDDTTLSNDEYIKRTEHYLDLMKANMDTDDWSIRYYAALAYLDLYAHSKDKDQGKAYLQEAFDLAYGNVNYLIDEQLKKNQAYLSEIIKEEPQKYDSPDRKKEIKKYNKLLEEERKTELPPVYQPLVLNLELVFDLADKLNISTDKKNEIDNVLHSGDEPLFLVSQLEDKFRFDKPSDSTVNNLSFDGKKLGVPANLLEQGTSVKVTVVSGDESTPFDEWQLNEVSRDGTTDVANFIGRYTNAEIKKYKYKDGDKVNVEIIPLKNSPYKKQTFTYDVSVTKKLKLFDDVKFTLEH